MALGRLGNIDVKMGLRYATGGMAVMALVSLGACEPGVLDPAGPVAAGERTILLNALGIMLAIVVPTILLTLGFAWWFRAGNPRAKHLPEWSYSGRLELLVWSIPLLVVIFLGGMGWVGSHALDPPRPIASKNRPVIVQVVAMDWKWLFIYPDQGVASVDHLVIPAGTPISFRITSATVMNSFFIPRLGSQIYAMAGMEATLNLLADRPGRFRGLSAHYSGKGFADMAFVVDAVTPVAFAGWVSATKAHGPALDGRAYLALARDEAKQAPMTYRAVAPRLFDAAVRQSGAPVDRTQRDGRQR